MTMNMKVGAAVVPVAVSWERRERNVDTSLVAEGPTWASNQRNLQSTVGDDHWSAKRTSKMEFPSSNCHGVHYPVDHLHRPYVPVRAVVRTTSSGDCRSTVQWVAERTLAVPARLECYAEVESQRRRKGPGAAAKEHPRHPGHRPALVVRSSQSSSVA